MFLKINNLEKFYKKDRPLIKSLDFNVNKGEIVSFIGESGSGKTTFLRVLAGLIPLSSGLIEYNNLNSLSDSFYILGHRLGIKDEATPYEDLFFW